MNTLLIGFLGGAFALVIPRLARAAVKVIHPLFARAIEFFTTIDDTAGDAIEAKTGFRIPEKGHMLWDSFFRNGITWAEENVFTEAFFKEMLFILKGDPSKILERTAAKMESIDWSKGLNQALPEDVKGLINATKENMAAKQIKASMAALPEAVRPTEEKIVEVVQAMAPAASKVIPAMPAKVEARDINAQIAETRRKLAEHLATLEAKK